MSADDGGAWALFGYLYQFMGTAACRLEHLSTAAGTATDPIIRLDMETHGQDAVAILADEIQLIQFKFSRKQRAIPPSELAEILRKLEKSEEIVLGHAKSVRLILRTNRELGAISSELRENVADVKLGPTSAADAEIIRRLGRRLQHEIVNLVDIQEALVKRAKKFGANDTDRLAARVTAYFIDVLHNAQGHRVVRQSDLDAVLADYAQPRSLHAIDIREFAKEEFVRFANELQITPLDKIIQRRPIEALLRRKGIAIAIVTGHGGCGKTRSVLRTLHDALDSRGCLAAALMPGPSPMAESLSELVARWRSFAHVPTEPFDRSFDRLRIANEGIAPPILVLGIDALDEAQSAADHRARVRQLILHFWNHAQKQIEEPEALLIVTCRMRKTFDQLVYVEGIRQTPSPDSVVEISIGDFTLEEFAQVWKNWFPEDHTPEIGKQVMTPPRFGEERTDVHASAGLAALAHPALLQCVLCLDDRQRGQLLSNAEPGWVALLAHYLDWFVTKVNRRQGDHPDDVKAVLQAVARADGGHSGLSRSYDLHDNWMEPAVRDTHFSRPRIKCIFTEAISCGLIKCQDLPSYLVPATNPVPWKWRFDFLPQYLRTIV